MEFNINKNDLVEPVLLASNVSEKRQSIPILSNVLISAAKNSIKITATDLEIEYKTTIEGVEVKKEGEVTVSARKLADLVRSIPETNNRSTYNNKIKNLRKEEKITF